MKWFYTIDTIVEKKLGLQYEPGNLDVNKVCSDHLHKFQDTLWCSRSVFRALIAHVLAFFVKPVSGINLQTNITRSSILAVAMVLNMSL